jgi:hypothetical protein
MLMTSPRTFIRCCSMLVRIDIATSLTMTVALLLWLGLH